MPADVNAHGESSELRKSTHRANESTAAEADSYAERLNRVRQESFKERSDESTLPGAEDRSDFAQQRHWADEIPAKPGDIDVMTSNLTDETRGSAQSRAFERISAYEQNGRLGGDLSNLRERLQSPNSAEREGALAEVVELERQIASGNVPEVHGSRPGAQDGPVAWRGHGPAERAARQDARQDGARPEGVQDGPDAWRGHGPAERAARQDPRPEGARQGQGPVERGAANGAGQGALSERAQQHQAARKGQEARRGQGPADRGAAYETHQGRQGGRRAEQAAVSANESYLPGIASQDGASPAAEQVIARTGASSHRDIRKARALQQLWAARAGRGSRAVDGGLLPSSRRLAGKVPGGAHRVPGPGPGRMRVAGTIMREAGGLMGEPLMGLAGKGLSSYADRVEKTPERRMAERARRRDQQHRMEVRAARAGRPSPT